MKNRTHTLQLAALCMAWPVAMPAQTPGKPQPEGKAAYVTLAGKTGGSVSHDELIKSKGLELANGSAGYAIRSFKMTVVTRDSEPKEFGSADNNGDLTEAMLDAIAAAPPGSRLYFEYVKCGDGKNIRPLKSLAPLNFTIR